MNIITLIDDYKRAIATDPELLAWSKINYDQAHNVYVDIDVRDQPGEDECPFCVIRPISKRVGRGITQREHGVLVVCCVFDTSSREQYGQDNITEYSSVKNLELFRQYVQDAIAGVDIGNARLDTIDIDYETFETFPFLVSDMAIQVIEETPMGGNFLV